MFPDIVRVTHHVLHIAPVNINIHLKLVCSSCHYKRNWRMLYHSYCMNQKMRCISAFFASVTFFMYHLPLLTVSEFLFSFLLANYDGPSDLTRLQDASSKSATKAVSCKGLVIESGPFHHNIWVPPKYLKTGLKERYYCPLQLVGKTADSDLSFPGLKQEPPAETGRVIGDMCKSAGLKFYWWWYFRCC